MSEMSQKPLGLLPGEMLDRFKILKKLGEGGFGAVYLAADKTTKYALKVESVNSAVKILKMEVYVLNALLAARKNRHFCTIYDKAQWGPFNFIAMTLVGKSLEDLCEEQPLEHLSMGTAIGVSIQALEALEDMHSIGYLHRDVKPGNFAVGLAEKRELRKLYVLDFGMCRKYLSEKGELRRPRVKALFRGTPEFASLSCHFGQDLSRKDDVESWLYMTVELMKGDLPWTYTDDMNEISTMKQKCRSEPGKTQLFMGCPQEMRQILTIIDALSYYDTPPYQQIYKLMRQSFISSRTFQFPYDWERPPPPSFATFKRN